MSTNGIFAQIYEVYADFYLSQGDYLSALDILSQGIERCSPAYKLEQKLNKITIDFASEITVAKEVQADRQMAEDNARREEQLRRVEATKQQKVKRTL